MAMELFYWYQGTLCNTLYIYIFCLDIRYWNHKLMNAGIRSSCKGQVFTAVTSVKWFAAMHKCQLVEIVLAARTAPSLTAIGYT